MISVRNCTIAPAHASCRFGSCQRSYSSIYSLILPLQFVHPILPPSSSRNKVHDSEDEGQFPRQVVGTKGTLCAWKSHTPAGSSGSFAFTTTRRRSKSIPRLCALLKTSQCEDRDDLVQIEHRMLNLQDRPCSRAWEMLF